MMSHILDTRAQHIQQLHSERDSEFRDDLFKIGLTNEIPDLLTNTCGNIEKVHTGKNSENEMASVLENKTELAEVLSAFIGQEKRRLKKS